MRSGVKSGARLRRYAITAMAVIAGLIVVGRITGILVDWLWFSSIGYAGVFWTILSARALLFAAVFALSACAIGLSGILAHRYARGIDTSQAEAAGPSGATEVTGDLAELVAPRIPWRSGIACAAVVSGLVIAASEISSWDIALRFILRCPLASAIRSLARTSAFISSRSPRISRSRTGCCNWSSAARSWQVPSTGCAVTSRWSGHRATLSPAAIAHGSALLGLFFAVKAWSWWLDRFLLLYGDNGVVVGASYTDVHVELPVLWMLVGLAAASSVALWINMRRRSYRLPAALALLVFGSSFVFGVIYPSLFQRFYVKPSELGLETPYIEHTIALTRQAYGLAQIEVKPFRGRAGTDSRLAAGQSRDHRQHPAVGCATADGYLRTVAGDQDLLQVSLGGHRPLSA